MAHHYMTIEEVISELHLEHGELEEIIDAGDLKRIETPEGTRFPRDQVEEVRDDIVGKKTAVLQKLPDGSSPLLRSMSPGGATSQAI
ncbi:MAG: hypothetical protein O7H41_05335 [Planctomycetota bacterium]|nr:hypothetical protein [Planctomycetota bacterium]